MSKPWIPIVLAILMALQVVAVAADTHRFHMEADRHLASADPHAGSHGDATSDPVHPAADGCQHCCHCHGSFHALIGGHKPELTAVAVEILSSPPVRLVSRPASSLYRPPKA